MLLLFSLKLRNLGKIFKFFWLSVVFLWISWFLSPE